MRRAGSKAGWSHRWRRSIVDAEMLRGWAEILKPVDFDDDDLALDAIKGVEPGGHFFGTAHTLARYESAFYRPLLSDWSNYESWALAGSRDATQRATEIWKKVLAAYVAAAARSRRARGTRRLHVAPRSDGRASAASATHEPLIMNARMYSVTPARRGDLARPAGARHGRGRRAA